MKNHETTTKHDLLNCVASLQAQLMLLKRVPESSGQITSHIERFSEKLTTLQNLVNRYIEENEKPTTS